MSGLEPETAVLHHYPRRRNLQPQKTKGLGKAFLSIRRSEQHRQQLSTFADNNWTTLHPSVSSCLSERHPFLQNSATSFLQNIDGS